MKSGIKTTEFWVTVISSIIIGGASQIGIVLDPVSVASIATVVVSYTMGRVFHKNAQVKEKPEIL